VDRSWLFPCVVYISLKDEDLTKSEIEIIK